MLFRSGSCFARVWVSSVRDCLEVARRAVLLAAMTLRGRLVGASVHAVKLPYACRVRSLASSFSFPAGRSGTRLPRAPHLSSRTDSFLLHQTAPKPTSSLAILYAPFRPSATRTTSTSSAVQLSRSPRSRKRFVQTLRGRKRDRELTRSAGRPRSIARNARAYPLPSPIARCRGPACCECCARQLGCQQCVL